MTESGTVEYYPTHSLVSSCHNAQEHDVNRLQEWWWDRQVVSNQYGLPGRAAKRWGSDTLEGDLAEEVLKSHRNNQPMDTATYRFRDEDYYRTKDFNLSDIEVPLLSVANWVGVRPPFDIRLIRHSSL